MTSFFPFIFFCIRLFFFSCFLGMFMLLATKQEGKAQTQEETKNQMQQSLILLEKKMETHNSLEKNQATTDQQGYEDLRSYLDSGAQKFSSDYRYQKPWEMQLETTKLLLWGLEAAYSLFPNLSFGVGVQSADLLTVIYGAKTNTAFTLKIKRLGDQTVRYTAQYNHNYNEKKLFLRFFPWNTRGFYVQAAALFQNWPGVVNLSRNNPSSPSLSSNPAEGAKISFLFPQNSLEYQMGWQWVNQSGFSAGFGVSYLPKMNVGTKFKNASTPSGENFFTPQEETKIRELILQRTPFLQNRFYWVVRFGSNF